ncbi:class I SAM-dependent methyltransferase [Novosphingopyxis sp. YJ-S2-01]|uniref:class I SAM-dependent methyltransferase n=1 Tax=Novosphingopyxis sp. YJ-S2-01 TaxID=2794021 RepID=UPI0018DDE7EC|nr:methyltransferase domain-containing protein [Novosphingopyxis sp. YJ-S2-01]
MTTHAEQMDAIYKVQRHIYDLTRKYYLLGRDRLIERLQPPRGGSVLEIACGTGRNLVAAARAYPDVHFFGLDISEEMLISARAAVSRAGLDHRVTLARADATAFDAQALFGVAKMDRAYISYALSMIPDWRAAIGQGVDVLSPDGCLHVVDFGQQERLPKLFRSGLHAWLARFHVAPRAELPELVDRYYRDGHDVAFTRLYGGYAWAAEIAAA